MSENAGGGDHGTGRFKIPCSCTKNTRYLKIQHHSTQGFEIPYSWAIDFKFISGQQSHSDGKFKILYF